MPGKRAFTVAEMEADPIKQAVFTICVDTLTSAASSKWNEKDVANSLLTHMGRNVHLKEVQELLPKNLDQLLSTVATVMQPHIPIRYRYTVCKGAACGRLFKGDMAEKLV
jgi:hypothetical protein